MTTTTGHADEPLGGELGRLPSIVRDGARAAWRTSVYARQPLSIVTPRGWVVVVCVAASWAAGARLNWLELLAGAVTGVVAFVIALATTFGRAEYDVSVTLHPDRVVVGGRAMATLTVRNGRGQRSAPAHVEMSVGTDVLDVDVPSLAGGEEHEMSFVVPTHRRQVVHLGPVTSVRTDPLRLIARRVTRPVHQELLVHPATVPLHATAGGAVRDLEGHPTRDPVSSDVSFHALRDYQPGDDRRHVHWRSSARTGTLMVRQFEETRRSHLAVALSPGLADYADADEFELGVSIAGSLALQALREERMLDVVSGSHRLRTATPAGLLDDLTRTTGIPGKGLLSAAAHVSRVAGAATVTAVVVGSRAQDAELRDAARLFPPHVRAIALVAAPGDRPAQSVTGQLLVLRVPDLDSLGPALRRWSTP